MAAARTKRRHDPPARARLPARTRKELKVLNAKEQELVAEVSGLRVLKIKLVRMAAIGFGIDLDKYDYEVDPTWTWLTRRTSEPAPSPLIGARR